MNNYNFLGYVNYDNLKFAVYRDSLTNQKMVQMEMDYHPQKKELEALVLDKITTKDGRGYLKKKFSLKKMIITPGVLGMLGGIPLFLTRTTLPGPLYKAVGFVGSLNTPLAMIVIGAQLARADLGSLLKDKKLYEGSAIKLLLIPLVTMLVMLPFRNNHLLYVAAVILSGAPAAGVTSMFAEKFDRSPERTAELVSFSTLLSIFTLPVVAVLAETIAA